MSDLCEVVTPRPFEDYKIGDEVNFYEGFSTHCTVVDIIPITYYRFDGSSLTVNTQNCLKIKDYLGHVDYYIEATSNDYLKYILVNEVENKANVLTLYSTKDDLEEAKTKMYERYKTVVDYMRLSLNKAEKRLNNIKSAEVRKS